MSSVKPLLPPVLATFTIIVGLGMVVPVLPFQVTALGGEIGAAPLIFAAFSAAAFISAPAWGWLSDRLGRRPVLIASALTTVVAYLWLANAETLFGLYASRVFAGLMAGWLAVSAAYVADVTSEADRAMGMGLLGAAFGAGFTVGPALGGWSVGGSDPNLSLPAFAAAGCTAAGLLIALMFLREPERHSAEGTSRFSSNAFRVPDISRLLLLHFTIFLVFTAMEGVFAIWAAVKFGLGAQAVGYYLAFAGLVTVIVQGGVVRRLVSKFGEAKVLMVAAATLFIAMLAIVATVAPLMILLPMALLAIGVGLHGPAMQSLLSQVAPEGLKGGTLGTAQSAQSLARIIGSAWGAAAFTFFGADAPFLIGAAILVGAVVFASVLVRRFPKTKKDTT